MSLRDPTPADYATANRCVETIRAYWSERGYSGLVIWCEKLTIVSNMRDGFPPGRPKEMT